MDTPKSDLTVNPLGLDREVMRAIGYQTVDMLVELLAEPDAGPVLRRATRDEMEARLDGPPPEEPTPFDVVLEGLATDVLPFMSRCDHPRYFAFIPSCTTWPSALGDLIASGLNVYGGSWMESAGPSQCELTLLDWFRTWIGYPEGTAGVLVSGGSGANMTALACAREALVGAMNDRLVVYVSDQAHSSMARAGRVLGFRPDQVRVLPVDASFRMQPTVLAQAIDADRERGYEPLFVAAAAGSTNTGAIDPLADLAAVCRDRGIWFHVDAAYGGFSMLTERGQTWLAGIEEADSVTLDPHKWLYQPFECGCLLVRNGDLLRQAFEITPDYLKDCEVVSREVNFSDLGIQLTRMSRALKLWVSLSHFGVAAFRDAIDRALDLARLAEQRIRDSSTLELLLPASLGIVCFRRRFDGDESDIEAGNAALVQGLADSGFGLISSTRLKGRYALRLCVLNHTTGPAHVTEVLDWLEQADVRRAAGDADSALVRLDDVEQLFGESTGSGEVSDLTDVAVLDLLDDDQRRELVTAAVERVTMTGETVVAQWEPSRDFYVVLEGSVEAWSDGERRGRLVTGDCFGEVAAMDWGASFGRARSATIVATSPTRLLVVPAGAFQALMKSAPRFAAHIEARARNYLSDP